MKENIAYYMVPTILHSGKGKSMETVKSGCQEFVLGGRRDE